MHRIHHEHLKLARPGTPLGGRCGRAILTKRLPRDLKKSFARDGIGFFEISDIGEYDTDRIATFDESGRLVPMRNRESEENGIAGGKRLSLV